MPVKRFKGSKAKSDKLFSLIIRFIGVCRMCGDTDYRKLQCAHIISRRFSATRTDTRNAWPLCWTCHRRLTDWPREHSHFITETIGTELYDELKLKAEVPTKMDWDLEYLRLKDIADTMGIRA